MLLSHLLLWLFLLPYTVSFDNLDDQDPLERLERINADKLLRDHCETLIHDGFCNLECHEAILDLEKHSKDHLQSDCVLFPVQTKLMNLTQTFDYNITESRHAMFVAATMTSIYMEAKVATLSVVAPNKIKVFLEVNAAVPQDEIDNKRKELELEYFRISGVTAEIHQDDVPKPKPEPKNTFLVFVIGAAIIGTLFGGLTVSVRSSNRTKDSRTLEAPVWFPPKENPLGYHYQPSVTHQFGQQLQNYEHYLNGPLSHHNYGFQQSPNMLHPGSATPQSNYQQSTVLYTQACCGNITTPIHSAELNQPINGIYPIHAVVLRADKDEPLMITDIQKILEAGGNINEKTCIEKYWNPENKAVRDEETALHIAVTRNLFEVADFLLKNGADQWAINRSNSTCMHEAVLESSIEMLRLLLKYHKADTKNKLSNGSSKLESLNLSLLTPLMCCAYAQFYFAVEMAKMLIEAGANVDTTEDKKRRNVVHYAAMLNNGQLLDYLLSLDNIDLKALDDDECTALMLAVQNGYTEIVEKLLAAGASYVTTNVNLQNALHVAEASNFLDIVKMFKESKLPKDQKKRKSSAASSPHEGKRTPPTDPRGTLADLTNTNTVFQTPPSSYENNLNMGYHHMYHSYLTPPESEKPVGYDFTRHSSQLFV